jgi:hypothetical protein
MYTPFAHEYLLKQVPVSRLLCCFKYTTDVPDDMLTAPPQRAHDVFRVQAINPSYATHHIIIIIIIIIITRHAQPITCNPSYASQPIIVLQAPVSEVSKVVCALDSTNCQATFLHNHLPNPCIPPEPSLSRLHDKLHASKAELGDVLLQLPNQQPGTN